MSYRHLLKLFLCLLLVAVIGTLPVLVGNDGLWLLNSDAIFQNVQFIIETKRMLLSGTPLWSWNHYFGDNFIGAYTYYTLGTPFAWLDCLVPYRYMLQAFTISLFLKLLVCGWLAWIYFRKMGFSENLSTVGAAMYTFSSWSVVNLTYYHFLEPMMVFPLLLVAVENYIHAGRYRNTGLIAASFIVIFVNFYFAFCALLTAFIYFVFRIAGETRKCKLLKLSIGIADAIIGILTASVILLPTILFFIGGDRTSSSVGYGFTDHVINGLSRMLWLLFPKLTEGNQHLPIIDGTFVLYGTSVAAFIPMVGVSFALIYVWRHKKNWLSLLIITCVFIYLTPLNGIFTLFTNPNYGRWSYALVMFLILATLYEIRDGRFTMQTFGKYMFFLSAVAVSYIAFNAYMNRMVLPAWFSTLLHPSVNFSVLLILIILNLVCLAAFFRFRTGKVLLTGVVFCSFIQLFEFCAYHEGWLSYDISVVRKGDANHRMFFQDNDFQFNNKEGFHYRTDFIVFPTYANMGLMKGWPSVETYSSAKNKSVSRLMDSADRIVDERRNFFVPSNNRGAFDALMSVRTIVKYHDKAVKNVKIKGAGFVRSAKSYDVYSYKYYIPMGFTYDKWIPQSVIDSLNPQRADSVNIPQQMLATVSVRHEDEAVFSRYLTRSEADSKLYNDTLSLAVDSISRCRRVETCDRFSGDTRGFSAHINLKRDNMVFFSVPADPGFTAKVDGSKTKIYNVNLGLSAILVPKGSHNIRFDFMPQGLKVGAGVSILSLLIAIGIGMRERKASHKG